jgi:hypothetical protein
VTARRRERPKVTWAIDSALGWTRPGLLEVRPFQIASALTMLSLVLSLGCSDEPTQPQVDPTLQSTAAARIEEREPAHRSPSAVVVNRVLTRAKGNGTSVLRFRQTWSVPIAAAPRLEATLLMPRPRSDNLTPETATEVHGLGLVRAAAPHVSLECGREVAWQRVQPADGRTLLLRGHGSVPYEEIDILSGERRIGSIRARWRRLPNSWLLASQEYQSEDGTVRDIVTLTHFDVSGAAEPREVAKGSCARPPVATGSSVLPSSADAFAPFRTVGVRSQQSDPRWSATVGAALSNSCEVPSDAELESGDCRDQYFKLVGAYAAYVSAAAAVYTTCVAPEPIVTKIACLTALSAYTGASAMLGVANLALEKCKAESKFITSLTCGCNLATRSDDSTTTSVDTVVRSGEGLPRPSEECLPGEGSGSGTSDGGGGGGSDTVWYTIIICTFEDHYNEYGQYAYSVNKGCYYTLAAM